MSNKTGISLFCNDCGEHMEVEFHEYYVCGDGCCVEPEHYKAYCACKSYTHIDTLSDIDQINNADSEG